MNEIKKEIWEMLKDFHIKNIRDFSLLWWVCMIGMGVLGAGFFYASCVLLPIAFSGIFQEVLQ